LDGGIKTTFEDYAAGDVYNSWVSVSLGALTAGTIYTLKLQVDSKNDASSNYYCSPQYMVLVKT
jgi:hypothetical protein